MLEKLIKNKLGF